MEIVMIIVVILLLLVIKVGENTIISIMMILDTIITTDPHINIIITTIDINIMI
jgi:hypothetical protein